MADAASIGVRRWQRRLRCGRTVLRRDLNDFRHRVPRRGATLLEAIAAIVILAAVVTAVAQTLALVALERRAIDRQQLASQAAANVLERLLALSWDALSNEAVVAPELAPEVRDVLRAAALRVDVSAAAGEPAAKRVRVTIGWENDAGEFVTPVQLTGWKFRAQGAP